MWLLQIFTMVFFNMPQHHPPTGIEYLSLSGLSGLCAFQTLTSPPLKFHKYSPAINPHIYQTMFILFQNARAKSEDG